MTNEKNTAPHETTARDAALHNGTETANSTRDVIFHNTTEIARDTNSHSNPEIARTDENTSFAYKRLYQTIRTLRSPHGCPWDKEQTPLSMRANVIEEACEVVDAISEGDATHTKEELGDVLLNATMIAYMYEQQHSFTVAEMLDALTEKLIRRHPHVFPESEGKAVVVAPAQTGAQVLAQWDAIKAQVEKRNAQSVLDEVPKGFPALLRAYKLQKKAAKKGFDWIDVETVRKKLFEELAEVEEAVTKRAQKECITDSAKTPTEAFTEGAPLEQNQAQLHVEEEIGDALFALVNYARHLGVEPELALSRANEKFYRRFSYVEAQCHARAIPMDASHLAEEDALWNEAKKKGL